MAILCICLGIVNAAQVYYGYKKGQDEYMDLKELCIIQPKEESELPALNEQEPVEEKLFLPEDAPAWNHIDFEKLHEISGNVVAWIELPGIDASYPVMQAEDNEYYLHRDINGDYLFAGSIFMDRYNDPKLRNMNTIIYGHNMNDRSMFGKLREYRNKEFYDGCPYFWIYTDEFSYLYQIFSVHPASDGSSTFTVKFIDADSFDSWLNKMKNSSEVSNDITPNITDQIVTLSTCTGINSEKQVVQGILIAEVREDTVVRLR